ncbi:MAG: hypothetical protein LQ352_004941 [Teloschistes flavicans]|nr:MAG: hypothetical protein LQ352_004941 [Teloschistes flavicans]
MASVQNAPVLDIELDMSPPQPNDQSSSMRRDSSCSNTGRSLGSTTRSNSPGLIPETVPYTLHITFEKEALPTTVTGHVRLNDPSDYKVLERIAEEFIQINCESDLAGKTLYFRNGDCTIVGDDTDSHVHGLSSTEDWRDVCTVLENFFASNKHQRQRLLINRDYFALLTRRISDERFAASKQDEIWRLMKESFDKRDYIPRTDLTRVTSADMIRQIILEDPLPGLQQAEQESFIQTVLRHGRKLLAMCVYFGMPMRCLKVMMDAGHEDSTLESNPLEKKDICHQRCGLKFSTLVEKQGSFSAAEFFENGEHKQLHLSTVLPLQYHPQEEGRGACFPEGHETISENNKSKCGEGEASLKQRAFCGSGAFSEVYRVKLDPAHHKLSTVSLNARAGKMTLLSICQDKNTDFALKVFIDRHNKTGDSFTRELKVLDELRKHPNDHIATHLATWTQDGKYYMLFPYAQCNLGQYMRHIPFGNLTKRKMRWFLRQLLGLASALNQIHNLSGAESSATSSTTLRAPEDQNLRKSAYHHDLRPENILYFRMHSYDDGEFWIADFGSGKVHTYRTGSGNTKSPNGHPTYEPPEFAKEMKTSRPYDIWSMGCVFLELLVWAVFGHQSVQTFHDARGGRRFPDSQTEFTDDDAFWQMDQDGNTKLRQPVIDQLQRLRDEIQCRGLVSFEKVLDLVGDMLDTNRQTRIPASRLWKTLDRICDQAATLEMEKLGDDALLADVATDSKNISTYLPRISTDAPNHHNPEVIVSPTVTITNDGHAPSKQPAQYIEDGFLAASPVVSTTLLGRHRRSSSANSFTVSSRSRGLSDSSMRVQNGSPTDEMDGNE